MRTIAIDGNEANITDRVGVNFYAFEILRGLHKLQDNWKDRLTFIVYLKDEPLQDMPKELVGSWEYRVLSGKGLWILTRLMPWLWLNKDNVSLLFSPSHYTIPFSVVPRVCSIMDLGYLKFTGQFEKKVFWQLKYWSAISVLVSKHIIAISRATKEDIVRQYPFASKKTSVIHLGFDRTKFNTKVPANDVRRIKEKYHIVDDYVLYLGTLKPSKNIERVIEAFGQIGDKYPNLKLVIAGKKGWLFDEIFKTVNKCGISDKVVFTDYFPDEDKPALLSGAKMLVSPSLFEGFGLHVLEAMACGTPVVVSDICSYPEIVGEAGLMVDPYEVSSIREGLEKILNMTEKQYNDLVAKGISQAGKFSWEDTSLKTLKLLEEQL